MCGINGYNFENATIVNAMNKAIKHRGPDDDGVLIKDDVTLGQVRLSILDLSGAGHQPMYYNKKVGASSSAHNKKEVGKAKVAITFNGEIYNYMEIRDELKLLGYAFSTKTDTEVILAAYLEWGVDCVNKFNGMWAFCIYDMKKRTLFLSRDRLGQKPLYYYNKNGMFIFSSELKSILSHKALRLNSKKNLSLEAIQFYFSLGFIPAPYTIYEGVSKLEQSTSIVYDLKTQKIKKKWKYYQMPKFKPLYDKKKLVSEGRKLLKDAVKLRMRSDVEVGAFLSGGLDSSTIVGDMSKFIDLSKLHTFSLGFKGKNYDETNFINIVKDYFKTRHHHYYFKESDFSKNVDEFAEIYDEPFGDYSGFPTYVVSQIAKKNVTVSLSGDGGDEIFAGYNMHMVGSRMDFIRSLPKFIRVLGSKIPAKKNLDTYFSLYSLKRAFKLSLMNPKRFYSDMTESIRYNPKIFKKWGYDTFSKSFDIANGKYGDAFRIHDLLYRTMSDNFLTKVDRASMKVALEVRSPFLDYRFIEFAQRIPTSYKIDLFTTKKLMREIIKDIVPKEIFNRKDKRGFTPPLEHWILSNKYKPVLSKGLKIIECIDKELFDYYNDHVFKGDSKVYSFDKIRLFLFTKWYERWVKK